MTVSRRSLFKDDVNKDGLLAAVAATTSSSSPVRDAAERLRLELAQEGDGADSCADILLSGHVRPAGEAHCSALVDRRCSCSWPAFKSVVDAATIEIELPNGQSVAAIRENEVEHIYWEIFTNDAYLKQARRLSFPRGAAVGVVDGGAHIGLFSLQALSLCARVRVLAVEAVPLLAALASENLVRNGYVRMSGGPSGVEAWYILLVLERSARQVFAWRERRGGERGHLRALRVEQGCGDYVLSGRAEQLHNAARVGEDVAARAV